MVCGMTCGEQSGDFVVDTVNPRLKSYNRPLFLALLIGLSTLAGTLLLFLIMVNNCDGNKTLVVGDFEDVEVALNEGSVGTCQYYTQILKLDLGKLVNQKCYWTGPGKSNLCDDWGGGNQRDVLDQCATDYSKNSPIWESVIQIRYKECPPFLTTLGAAFGYMSFIELFFTGIFIFPMLRFGIIKNGKDSKLALNVQEWVTEMWGSKDTAGEIKGHVMA